MSPKGHFCIHFSNRLSTVSPLYQGIIFLFKVIYLLLSGAIRQKLQSSFPVLTLISYVIILWDEIYWVAEFEIIVFILAFNMIMSPDIIVFIWISEWTFTSTPLFLFLLFQFLLWTDGFKVDILFRVCCIICQFFEIMSEALTLLSTVNSWLS